MSVLVSKLRRGRARQQLEEDVRGEDHQLKHGGIQTPTFRHGGPEGTELQGWGLTAYQEQIEMFYLNTNEQ